jgi:hypothetical protein
VTEPTYTTAPEDDDSTAAIAWSEQEELDRAMERQFLESREIEDPAERADWNAIHRAAAAFIFDPRRFTD